MFISSQGGVHFFSPGGHAIDFEHGGGTIRPMGMLKSPFGRTVLTILAVLCAGAAFVFPQFRDFLVPAATALLGAAHVEPKPTA